MTSPSTTAPRLGSIDLLRGLVMVLMALDHVRFFLTDVRFDPTDPARTNVALFATRWITHLCAPAFMFLAGSGARLSLGRGRDRRSLSRFLLTRGLWLVLLELTFARAAWQFNLDYGYTSALVLWALGWSMVGLAALVWLGDGWIATVGLSLVLLHNLLDDASPTDVGLPAWLWTILHQPGTISLSPTIEFFVLYPLIPWVGVMALGYVFAPVFTRPSPDRDRICVGLGLAACLGFVVLRLANGYGDPSPWVRYESETRSALSFLAATKYPASLQYLLMTLGPVLLLFPPFGRAHGLLGEVFRTFGRTPLFFWLLHVPLIHLIAVGLSLTRYAAVVPWLVQNPPVEPPPGYGYPLWVVYTVTLSVVVALYPVCRWFDELKRRRRSAWLSYL